MTSPTSPVTTTSAASRKLLLLRPALGNSGWILWDHAMVRTAGFPVDGPARLADESLARAADQITADSPVGGEQRARFEVRWHQHAQMRQAEAAAIARDARFLLAVTWQNRKILENAIHPFLAQIARGDSRSRKMRVREQVIAAYWQRYCLKSESIGFFGPTAWASVGGAGPVVVTVHGPSLVDQASVHFECWPIDQLARTLERGHDLRPWIAPRRAPHIQVGNGFVLAPDGTAETVDQLTQAVLVKADGRMPATDLAARLVAQTSAATLDQVFLMFAELCRKGWLIWKWQLSPTVRPETELRAFLDGIGSPARVPALALLDALARARDAVADAFMDSGRLAPALTALDQVYVEATGSSATRNDGLTYGGRTLVYPECRRDLAVSLGQGLVDAMAPLALILDSIRWMLYQVGEAVMELVSAAYGDLVAGSAGVPNAAMLWLACTPILGGQLKAIAQEKLAELQKRWQSVLRIPEGVTSAAFQVEEIRRAADDAFSSPPAAWTDARWCSPDVMIAAESEDAIREGQFRLVLGEVHAAVNTVDYCSMVPLHRRPEVLMACVDADHPDPRLLVALPRESRPRLTVRSHPALVRDIDYRLVLMPHIPVPRRGRVHLGGDVAVVRAAGGLCLVLPDGSRFGVMDLFSNAIRGEVAQAFDLYPAGYRPRVVIDQVVIARERWSLPAADLSFAQLPDEASRFAGCRAWMREHRLPRRVFIKSPLETKPFYVDFASPAFVEALVTAARRAVRGGPDVQLSVTEMLPDTDEVWLADADGHRYVAEFRFVAFDTRPASAAPAAGAEDAHPCQYSC